VFSQVFLLQNQTVYKAVIKNYFGVLNSWWVLMAYEHFPEEIKEDSIILLAGASIKKSKKQSNEDISREADLIDPSEVRALYLLDDGKTIIEHILSQLPQIMDELSLSRTVIVGVGSELEEKVKAESSDPRIIFIKQKHGATRFDNINSGFEEIEQPYKGKGIKQLFKLINQPLTDHLEDTIDRLEFYQRLPFHDQVYDKLFHKPYFTTIWNRGKKMPVDIFAGLAYEIVTRGKEQRDKTSISLTIDEMRKIVYSSIDTQIEEHMLPAWIQRSKIFEKSESFFRSPNMKERLEKYKEKIFNKTITSPLLKKEGDMISFREEEHLQEFYKYRLRQDIGVWITAADWPYQLESFRWMVRELEERGKPSFYLPMGYGPAIEPFREIAMGCDAPIQHSPSSVQVRGFGEGCIELEILTKYGNAFFTRPNRIANKDIIEDAFGLRKGNYKWAQNFAKFLYKHPGKVLLNREGKEGFMGIHYPVHLRIPAIGRAARALGAYWIQSGLLERKIVHYNERLRTALEGFKSRLSKGLTLDYCTDIIEPIFGCSIGADYVPIGTHAIDLDRERKREVIGERRKKRRRKRKDTSFGEFGTIWDALAVSRAQMTALESGNTKTLRKLYEYGIAQQDFSDVKFPLDFLLVSGSELEQGELSNVVRDKLDYARQAYKDGIAQNILVAGHYREDVALRMRDYLANSIHPDKIITLNVGNNRSECLALANEYITANNMLAGFVIGTLQHIPDLIQYANRIINDAVLFYDGPPAATPEVRTAIEYLNIIPWHVKSVMKTIEYVNKISQYVRRDAA